MTLPDGTVWELRSGGHPDNGGGFVASIAGQTTIGRNYSLQDGPALVVLDAVVDHQIVTTAAGGLPGDMVNNLIWIPDGLAIRGGYYHVTAVPDGHRLHLDRDAGFGGPVTIRIGGASGGLPVDAAFNRVLNSVGPGHTVNVQGGTYPLSGNVVGRASGSLSHPVRLRGYAQVPGDAKAPTVSMHTTGGITTGLRITGAHWLIEYLQVEGNGGPVVSGFRLEGDGVVAHRCASRGTGRHGFVISGQAAGCAGSAADGFGSASPSAGFQVIGAHAFATGCAATRGNGLGFEWGAATQVLAYCIAGSNTGAGFWSNVAAEHGPAWMLHCVAAHNGGSGLLLANTQANRRVYAQNCIFEGNAAFGIASDRHGKGAVTLLGCAFSGNGSGGVDEHTSVVAPVPPVEADVPILRDSLSADYRLRGDARPGIGVGWPGAFLDEGILTTWSGHPDLGAVQQAVRPVINPLWMET